MIAIILQALSLLWGSSIGRTVMIGGAAFLFGWFQGWDYGADGKKQAVQARDSYWRQKIEAANKETDARIQEAIDAYQESLTHDSISSNADLNALCVRDAACRRDKKRR